MVYVSVSVNENVFLRNASMEVGIVLWTKAYMSVVGLVGRQGGRSDMYSWMIHVSFIIFG